MADGRPGRNAQESCARTMTENSTLLFRCDASVAMGTGHAMRCLALAQAWSDAGGPAIFAMAETTPALEERLISERVQIVCVEAAAGSAEDAACVANLAGRCAAKWIVVDDYHFGADYQ